MPTAYLISYSQEDRNSRDRNAQRRYDEACRIVPPHAKRLSTIKCADWWVPPGYICAAFSGTNETVQSWVIQDPRARNAIDRAVEDITRTFRKGYQIVFLQTSCVSGTHRSVATAELIGQHLKRHGYKVVVQHPHRRPGSRETRRPGTSES